MVGYKWVSSLKLGKTRTVYYLGKYYVIYKQPNFGRAILTVYPY